MAADYTIFEQTYSDEFQWKVPTKIHGGNESDIPVLRKILHNELFETDVSNTYQEGKFAKLDQIGHKTQFDTLDPFNVFQQLNCSVSDALSLPQALLNHAHGRITLTDNSFSEKFSIVVSLKDISCEEYKDLSFSRISGYVTNDTAETKTALPAPEPSTFLLSLFGLICVLGLLRIGKKGKLEQFKTFVLLVVLFYLILHFNAIEVKAQSLLQQAYTLMVNGDALVEADEYWAALERFEQARQLYHQADYPLGEGIALDEIGLVYFKLELYHNTTVSFQQAAVLFQSIGDQEREVTTLNQLGLVYSRQGKYLSALQVFQNVLTIEQARNNRLNEGRTQNNIGAVYLNQGKYDTASEKLNEALTIAEEINDQEGQGKAFMNIGSTFRHTGSAFYEQAQYADAHTDFQEALTAYQEALALQQALGHAPEEGAALLSLGRVHRDLGRTYRQQEEIELSQEEFSQALHSFQSALDPYSEIESRAGVATALLELGETYREMQEYSEALTHLQQSLGIYRELEDIEGELQVLEQLSALYEEMDNEQAQATHLTDIGEIYYNQGRYDEAEDVLWDAVDIQDAIGDYPGLARSLMILGEISFEHEMYQDAIDFLAAALDIWREEDEQTKKGRTLTSLGAAYLYNGDCSDSLDFLQQALTIHQELEARQKEGLTVLYIGEAYLCLDDELAFDTLQQAQIILQEVADSSAEGQAHTGLGKLSVQQEEYESALDHFENALACYRTANDLAEQAIVHIHIGDIHQVQELYDDTMIRYQNALEIYRELEDEEGELAILQNMLVIQQTQGNQVEQAEIFVELAEIYLNQEQAEDAMNDLQQAFTIYTDLEDQAGITKTTMLTGAAQCQNGEYSDALASLQTALDIYRNELEDLHGEAKTQSYLGDVYFEMAADALETEQKLLHLQQAEALYEQALTLYQYLEYLGSEGRTLMKLGSVYSRQAELTEDEAEAEVLWAKAIETQELAVMILAEVDDHYNMILALMELGDTYTSMGLYWDGLEVYRRALGMMHETRDFSFEVLVYQGMTDAYSGMGDTNNALDTLVNANRSTDDPADAQEFLNQAEEILEQTLSTVEEEPEEETEKTPVSKEEEVDEEELQEIQEENNDPEGAAETLTEMADIEEKKGNTTRSVQLLEDALDSQQAANDYDGQEETVEKLEELAPDLLPPEMPEIPQEIPIQQPEMMDETAENTERPTPVGSPNPQVNTPTISDSETPEQRRTRLLRWAETLNNMGLVYLRQGYFRKAEEVFLKAKKIQEIYEDATGWAKTMNNRGLLRYMLGEYEKAAEHFSASLKTTPENEPVIKATLLNHLGLIAYRQAEGAPPSLPKRYTQALTSFRQAGELAKQEEHYATYGTNLNNTGLVYISLMRYYRKLGDQEYQSSSLAALPYYQKSMWAYQQALQAFQETLDIARATGGRVGQSATLHNIGKLYALLRLDQQALRYLYSALELERQTGNRMDEVRTLADIGYIYERHGEMLLRQGREILHTLFRGESDQFPSWEGQGVGKNSLDQHTISEPTPAPSQEGNSRLLSVGIIQMFKGAYRSQQGVELYKRSLAVRETLRAAAGIEEFKISIAEQSVDVYQQAILLLMRMNQKEAAFNLSERARSRTFIEELGNRHLKLFEGAAKDLRIEKRFMQEELARLHQELAEADKELKRQQAEITPENRVEKTKALALLTKQKLHLQEQIDAQQQALNRLLEEIKLKSSKYDSLVTVNPLTLDEVQERLEEDTTLLSYFVTPEITLAFVLRRGDFDVVEVPVQEEELRKMVEQVRHKPKNPKQIESQQLLKELFETLIKPVFPYFEDSDTVSVALVPHGILHQLPFSALLDGETRQYFGDQYVLSDLASASLLRFTAAHTADRDVGDPRVVAMEYSPPNNPLTGAKREVKTITRLYAPDAQGEFDATEKTLRRELSKARILHLSGHGFLKETMPMFSGIIFGAEYPHDGIVEVHDVYGFDLNGTELVFLSACQSGLGIQSRGDDIIGLKRAFIYAGATGVIGTLWNVDDSVTAEFTEHFYTALHSGLNQAQALQQAQQETRVNHPHPYQWAAFVLTGE